MKIRIHSRYPALEGKGSRCLRKHRVHLLRDVQLCVQTCSNSNPLFVPVPVSAPWLDPTQAQFQAAPLRRPPPPRGRKDTGSWGVLDREEKVHKPHLCSLDTTAVAFSTRCPATLELKHKEFSRDNIDERQREKICRSQNDEDKRKTTSRLAFASWTESDSSWEFGDGRRQMFENVQNLCIVLQRPSGL